MLDFYFTEYNLVKEPCVTALVKFGTNCSKFDLSQWKGFFGIPAVRTVPTVTHWFSSDFVPKRLTATEKWGKEWFQALSLKHKCVWNYLCDACDHAGIFEPNFKLASLCIGTKITEEDFVPLGKRVRKLANGKWLLAGFVRFQYGDLTEANRAHKSVLKRLKEECIASELEKLLSKEEEPQGATKPLTSPSLGAKDKDKDKDKVQDKDIKEGVQGKPFADPLDIPPPLNASPAFVTAWQRWMTFRRGLGKKPNDWGAMFSEQLTWLATFQPDRATRILERSIRNGYQGLFEKGTEDGNNSKTNRENPRNAGILPDPDFDQRVVARVAAMQANHKPVPQPVATEVAPTGRDSPRDSGDG